MILILALFGGIRLETHKHDYLLHKRYYEDFILYVRIVWNSKPSSCNSWALDECVVWVIFEFLSCGGYGQRNSNVDIAFVVLWPTTFGVEIAHWLTFIIIVGRFVVCYLGFRVEGHGEGASAAERVPVRLHPASFSSAGDDGVGEV